MNKIILMGRLTADPELRQTQSGIASCRFTVAVNRRFKNDKCEYEADFITCIAWRQAAEFTAKYFRKGSMICIDGTLRTGSYKDKNHPDVTHYTTDVLVENAEFCGGKRDSEQAQQSSEKTQFDGAGLNFSGDLSDFEEILSDGDVPF